VVDPEINTESEKKPPRDRSSYKCWSCGKFRHLANSKQCPNYKEKTVEQEAVVNTMWQEYEASLYMTIKCKEEYTINNVVNIIQALELTKVLLDKQADISIVHPALLRDIQKAEMRIRIKGVGDLQLIVDQVKILEKYFPVYESEHTKAKVFSFADVEDLYDITGVHRRPSIP
jgi:hypothetical protein